MQLKGTVTLTQVQVPVQTGRSSSPAGSEHLPLSSPASQLRIVLMLHSSYVLTSRHYVSCHFASSFKNAQVAPYPVSTGIPHHTAAIHAGVAAWALGQGRPKQRFAAGMMGETVGKQTAAERTVSRSSWVPQLPVLCDTTTTGLTLSPRWCASLRCNAGVA